MDDNLNEEKEDPKVDLCLLGNEPTLQKETKINEIVCENAKKLVLHRSGVDYPTAPPSHKELRKFLEEEQRFCAENLGLKGIQEFEEVAECSRINILKPNKDKNKALVAGEDNYIVEEKLEKLEIHDVGRIYDFRFPSNDEPHNEEDEDIRKQRGKGNIEKWLQFLLKNAPENHNVIVIVKEVEDKDHEITVETNGSESGYPISNGEKKDDNRTRIAFADTPIQNPPYRIDPEKTKLRDWFLVKRQEE